MSGLLRRRVMLANGGTSVSHRWCEGSIFPPRDTGTDWTAEDFVGAYFTFDTDRLPVGHPLRRIVLEVNSSIRNNNALTVELGVLTNGRFTVKETVSEWLDGSNLDVAIPDYGKRYVVLRITPNAGYTVTSLYVPSEKYFYTPVVDRYGRLPNVTILHSGNNYAGWYYLINDGLTTGARTDGSSLYASEACLLKCAPVLSSTATSLQNAFQSCRSLIDIDLSGLNTAAVTNMSYMFNSCTSLQTLDLSGLNTAAVTNMQSMFSSCWNLENFTAPTFYKSVGFSNCSKLTHDSLMSIINNLATVTTSQTLTLDSTNKAKLTTDEIAIATEKGWTVA